MRVLEGLLAGIVADPLEETRWLVLADWLEEFDDPRRAELLRLHRKMLAGADRGGWRVERGRTDPAFSHHSPHSTLHDLQARMVALLGEGVRPCVPQETITLPGGGWSVEGGGTNPSSPATRHPPAWA